MPNDYRVILAIGGVAILAYFILRHDVIAVASGAAGVVKDTAHAINPTNPDNIFYGAVNDVGQAMTGDSGWNLGGAIYDWMH